MVKHNYSVSLDEEVFDMAKRLMIAKSISLSPIINQFLIKWIKEQREYDEVVKEWKVNGVKK